MTKRKQPFWVTFPAECSWDIEWQWKKFREHYAMDPEAAERENSKFKIDVEQYSVGNGGIQSMIGDLLNMTVVDTNSKEQFDLKRREELLGTLCAFGRIEFERTYKASKETFLYDRKTGYDKASGENAFNIGDRVIFETWWNMNESQTYLQRPTFPACSSFSG